MAISRYQFFLWEVNMTSKQKEIAKLIFSVVLNGTIIGLIVFLLIQFAWKKFVWKILWQKKKSWWL